MVVNRISPTFTDDEIKSIKAVSAKLGYNPSQFLRHATLSVAQKYSKDLGIGNPISEKSPPLTDRLRVRVSPQQINKLKIKAKEYGYSLSGILREAAFTFFEKENIYPKEVLSQANILTALIRNIGTNINQIARHTNRKKNITIFNLIKARQLIDNLEDEVSRFLTVPYSHDCKVDESKRKDF